MRKFELRSDDMKIAKKNVADIWEDMKPDEKSSDVKCKECNVMCEESACFTLHCTGDAYKVMFLDSNTATAAHKARTHGPGWRTAHASSLIVVLGSDS